MANTVAVMVEYMDVLIEKYNLLHHQLLEARIMVEKNHIVIQRDKPPDKAVPDCQALLEWKTMPAMLISKRKASQILSPDRIKAFAQALGLGFGSE